MRLKIRKTAVALTAVASLFLLFQNCSPAKISSSNPDSTQTGVSGEDDLGSSAPPTGSTPVNTPPPVSTPVATPTPVPSLAMSVSVTMIDFGRVPVNFQSQTRIVRVTNTGILTINRLSYDVVGANFDYDVFGTTTCSGSLAPGQSCNIGVFFYPYQTGNLTGVLQISSPVPDSPKTVQLQGVSYF